MIKIKGGRLFDPKNGIDEEGDIYIVDGKVRKEGVAEIEIDAAGLYVFPGFVDLHAHLREPGREDEETIETGSRAAVKGGFTSVCAMPNTEPPVDNQGVARFVKEKGEKAGYARIFPIGTITKGRKGEEISEFGDLIEGGCVGVSDDGDCVRRSDIIRRALEYAKMFNIPVIEHPEDTYLSEGGQINEGRISTILGMGGIPSISESIIVARDIEIANFVGGWIHLTHISVKDSLEKIIEGRKKQRGKITCDVTAHHLVLTEDKVKEFNSNFKMKPPLRSEEDRRALVYGLRDGMIDAIITDHAPHAFFEKELEFDLAPFGVVGLETAFSSLYTYLVEKGELELATLVMYLSSSPALLFSLPYGEIRDGGIADLVLVDLKGEWEVREDTLASKSKNSPYLGEKLRGVVVCTIVDGRIVYREGEWRRRNEGISS